MQEIKVYRLSDDYIRYFDNYCYCGEPGLIGDEPGELVLVSEILGGGKDEVYIAEIQGDSMKDANLEYGDQASISTSLVPKAGDIVLAVVDGELLLKFLHVDGSGGTWLVPANEAYRSFKVDFDGKRNKIVGVLTKVLKNRPRFDTVLLRRVQKQIAETYRSVKTTDDKECRFHKYISAGKDRKMVMERLHSVLDGKRGVEILKVLHAAKQCGYIERLPSEGDLNGEFDIDISHSQFYRDKNKFFSEDELSDYMEALT